ncbi:hypothetical protein K9M42_00570 [Patescibacteria group bacterium]|nr:hypothetical protein [Patescibacteria group bacterium]
MEKYLFNLVKDNIVWFVLVALFLLFIVIPIQSIKIFSKLIKNNRKPGYGERLADRYIDLYLNKESRIFKKKMNISINTKSSILSFNVNGMGQVDKKLQELDLLEIKDNKIIFSKNKKDRFKNYIIFKLVRFYLINFLGDKKDLYKINKNA